MYLRQIVRNKSQNRSLAIVTGCHTTRRMKFTLECRHASITPLFFSLSLVLIPSFLFEIPCHSSPAHFPHQVYPPHYSIMKPMFSAGNATCCTVLSVFGVIFLGTMAFLFSLPAVSLTHTVNDPDNPADVAKACLTATAFYGFMILFCGCQVTIKESLK